MRVLLLILLMMSPSAFAACLTPAQAEADRVLRIQSELMIIGLNCQHRAGHSGLYNDYKRFTNIHAYRLEGYESEMERYFTQAGEANPSKKLHEYKTSLANKVATDAAQSPNAFCDTYASRVPFALGLGGEEVRKWAATYPTSRPECR